MTRGSARPETSCADKFEALAVLFGGPSGRGGHAVRTLLTPCSSPSAAECAMLEVGLLSEGERALRWFENASSLVVLEAEFARLFDMGDEQVRTGSPRLSPCAAAHLPGPAEAIRQDVRDLYADLGFDHSGWTESADVPDCPCHIASELAFVSHCLRMAGQGLSGASRTAAEFLSGHLFAWGIVFAAAVTAVAMHPVTRFAGAALEGILFCEAGAQFRLASDGQPSEIPAPREGHARPEGGA